MRIPSNHFYTCFATLASAVFEPVLNQLTVIYGHISTEPLAVSRYYQTSCSLHLHAAPASTPSDIASFLLIPSRLDLPIAGGNSVSVARLHVVNHQIS